jgi:hypothetical protein
MAATAGCCGEVRADGSVLADSTPAMDHVWSCDSCDTSNSSAKYYCMECGTCCSNCNRCWPPTMKQWSPFRHASLNELCGNSSDPNIEPQPSEASTLCTSKVQLADRIQGKLDAFVVQTRLDGSVIPDRELETVFAAQRKRKTKTDTPKSGKRQLTLAAIWNQSLIVPVVPRSPWHW